MIDINYSADGYLHFWMVVGVLPIHPPPAHPLKREGRLANMPYSLEFSILPAQRLSPPYV